MPRRNGTARWRKDWWVKDPTAIGPWPSLTVLGALHSTLKDHWADEAGPRDASKPPRGVPTSTTTYSPSEDLRQGFVTLSDLWSTDIKVRGAGPEAESPESAVESSTSGSRTSSSS